MISDLPFIDMEIVHTTENEMNLYDLLMIFKDQQDKMNGFPCDIIECDEKPKLHIQFSSLEEFTKRYQRSIPFLDRMMEVFTESQDLILKVTSSAKKFEIEEPNENSYLVLKISTNFKKPLVDLYRYMTWFGEKFGDFWTYEEVDDGILVIYNRKTDFLTSIYDKLDYHDFQQWLQSKNFSVPPEFLEMFKDLMKK